MEILSQNTAFRLVNSLMMLSGALSIFGVIALKAGVLDENANVLSTSSIPGIRKEVPPRIISSSEKIDFNAFEINDDMAKVSFPGFSAECPAGYLGPWQWNIILKEPCTQTQSVF